MKLNNRVFIRRLRLYARHNGLEFRYDPRRGKGSHGRVYLGDQLTTVKHGEISPGLVRKMLSDLDVDPGEF